jgi:branched-chain amino acid aminotransferase
MIASLSKKHADERGYDDALMFDWRGQVAEATGANAFFVREGKLFTPTPDCFLNGITRQTVMDLAQRRGIEVEERAIWPDELESFEQMFITGSAAEVTFIRSAVRGTSRSARCRASCSVIMMTWSTVGS